MRTQSVSATTNGETFQSFIEEAHRSAIETHMFYMQKVLGSISGDRTLGHRVKKANAQDPRELPVRGDGNLPTWTSGQTQDKATR